MTQNLHTILAQSPNINTLWARIIVDELVKSGLRHVVISPGSRSTPLVLQFHEHPEIHDISIIDERAAAFFALGLAQAKQQPVALLCTSGTATANYFPAICEANHSNIPLIVLTADRPPALHDCGAPQAMNQHNLYANHIRWFHQLSEPKATTNKLLALRSITCRAFAIARGLNTTQPGPVHLNIPFEKPLEPTNPSQEFTQAITTIQQAALIALSGRPDHQPHLQTYPTSAAPDPHTIQALVDLIQNSKRPLILAGADPRGTTYREALRDLAQHIAAPIAAEPTSNIRYWNERGPNVLAAADILFQSNIYNDDPHPNNTPDLIIRTGRAPLLWATQKLVANPTFHTNTTQVVINPDPELQDPDHLVSHHFTCDPNLLFQHALQLLKATPNTSQTTQSWLQKHQNSNAAILHTIHHALEKTSQSTNQLTTPGFWHAIGHLVPESASLFVSNSMPIRDLDTFMGHANQSLNLYFNRGINGIDGILSTGLGIAQTNPNTIIITGDVAFRHDLSSLLLARELNINATIIVLNNGGGAIFDYLPIARLEVCFKKENSIQSALTSHFLTPSPIPISEIVPRSIELLEPTTWPEFRTAFNTTLHAPGLQLIHVQTNHVSDKHLSDELRAAAALSN